MACGSSVPSTGVNSSLSSVVGYVLTSIVVSCIGQREALSSLVAMLLLEPAGSPCTVRVAFNPSGAGGD